MAIADYELQDAIVGDDQTATAAIPLQTRAGILEALELRHTGGSFQSLNPRELSTHPEHWWGVARPIPIEPYAAQVRVVVRVTVADAGVDIRARVGVIVSSVVTASAGSTSVVECVVTLPVSREPRVEVLSIEFRSKAGDAIATGVLVTDQQHGQVTLDGSGAVVGESSLYIGATHCYATPDVDSGNWGGDTALYEGLGGIYIGFARDSSGSTTCYTWPEDIPGAASPPYGAVLLDTFELGRFTIHGIAWSVEGIVGSPLPTTAAFRVGAYMRASDVLSMQAVAAQAYETRPFVWAPPMRDDQSGNRTSGCAVGYRAECLWSYRPDATGIEIAALVGVPNGQRSTRTLSLLVYDADGTTLEDEVIADVTIDEAARRTGPAEPGTLWAATAFDAWGGGDLLYAGPSQPDWQRLQMVRVSVPLSALSSLTERDQPYVLRLIFATATGTGARPSMHGVTVWERTRTPDTP